jgi:hypothetical protein
MRRASRENPLQLQAWPMDKGHGLGMAKRQSAILESYSRRRGDTRSGHPRDFGPKAINGSSEPNCIVIGFLVCFAPPHGKVRPHRLIPQSYHTTYCIL